MCPQLWAGQAVPHLALSIICPARLLTGTSPSLGSEPPLCGQGPWDVNGGFVQSFR